MTDLKRTLELSKDQLTWTKSLGDIVGQSTKDIEPRTEVIGQQRAVKAIRLAMGVKSSGYNVFVSGHNGSGRFTTVEALLKEMQKDSPIPDDLCYVNNFAHPEQPRLLRFKAGNGTKFKEQMANLVETLKKKIPAVFESEEFQSARNEIVNRKMGEQKALFKNFENKVGEENFMMVQVQVGPFTRPDLAPVVVGNPMKIEQLESLVEEGKFSQEELEKIKEKYKELSREMEQIFKQSRDIDKSIQSELEELAKKWVEPMLAEMLTPILDDYKSDDVTSYIGEVQKDIMSNLDRFRPKLVPAGGMGGMTGGQGQGGQEGGGGATPMLVQPESSNFIPYEVNLIVDNSETKKTPVIFETAPTFRNLFGAIERTVDSRGMWASDFRHIRSGSFLKANGGVLVLNARDALTELGVWQTLERTLRYNLLEIQTDPYSFLFTTALKPEKIPVNLKVVLIGEPQIYDLLHWYDEDFRKIFKVKAEFDPTMANDDENLSKLVGFISNICSQEDLLPLDPSAVETVARYGVRMGGRKKKITARFERISDLIRESDLKAREDNSELISGKHVEAAHEERIERVNMIEDKIHELIEDEYVFISTEGKKVGQINGLSVYSLPEFSFGRPSRITVKISMGKAGIINIEREADMSGNSFNKGVLILTGFLRSRFAQDKPMNLTASICFEQSYSGVDGDSASSTELYGLLSALSSVGLDQGIAVTGSVNQHGEVQAIGGVNEKIEGFFKVCQTKGLTGEQGVMIPLANVEDLILNSEVIEAVEQGKFHIWAVDTIDKGIELLTGVPSGEIDDKGNYPEGTINYLVNKKLNELSQGMKEFMKSQDENSQSKDGK